MHAIKVTYISTIDAMTNRMIIMIRSSPPPAAIPARAGIERPPKNDVTVVRMPPSVPVVTGDTGSVNKLLMLLSPDPLPALPLPKIYLF